MKFHVYACRVVGLRRHESGAASRGRLALVVVLVLGSLAHGVSPVTGSRFPRSSPAGSRSASEGFPWVFRTKPRSCDYSEDGSLGSRVVLVGLEWSNWGARRARARGKTVDFRGGEDRRYAATVVLMKRVAVQGKRYYRTMVVTTRFGKGTYHLQTPPVDDL